MNSLEMAKNIAKVLNDKKGTDIKILNIKTLSTLADYFVIASASNTTLVKALADEVDQYMSKNGVNPNRVEGYQTANWILLDYVGVIVHIFYKDTREFYGLEKLWADAPEVSLSDVIREE